MTNSQKEFDGIFNALMLALGKPHDEFNSYHLDEGNIRFAAAFIFDSCNALWERKLDEGDMQAVIAASLRLAIKANGPITEGNNLFASTQHTARAIIEYLRGEK